MKKILTAIALVASISTAGAANFVELAYENVNATPSTKDGAAQTIRVGKDVGGLNLGLQAKSRTIDTGGIKSSLEANLGKEFKLSGIVVRPFAGIGHDYGTGTTASSFDYGVVGIGAGAKINVFTVGASVKHRVNWDSVAPEQTAIGAFVGYPITKDFEARLNVGQSYRDIKEKTIGASLVARF
jgi:hypothetical protein